VLGQPAGSDLDLARRHVARRERELERRGVARRTQQLRQPRLIRVERLAVQ